MGQKWRPETAVNSRFSYQNMYQNILTISAYSFLQQKIRDIYPGFEEK
jgi:hypothetical protein